VVRNVAVGVWVSLLQCDQLRPLEPQLDSTRVRGVYPGYNRVQWLFIPPGCVARLGAEALLLRAGVVLEYNEWLGAEEAEGGGHLLIFFALVYPSPFGAAADGLTPSPHPAWACLSLTLAVG